MQNDILIRTSGHKTFSSKFVKKIYCYGLGTRINKLLMSGNNSLRSEVKMTDLFVQTISLKSNAIAPLYELARVVDSSIIEYGFKTSIPHRDLVPSKTDKARDSYITIEKILLLDLISESDFKDMDFKSNFFLSEMEDKLEPDGIYIPGFNSIVAVMNTDGRKMIATIVSIEINDATISVGLQVGLNATIIYVPVEILYMNITDINLKKISLLKIKLNEIRE